MYLLEHPSLNFNYITFLVFNNRVYKLSFSVFLIQKKITMKFPAILGIVVYQLKSSLRSFKWISYNPLDILKYLKIL